MRRFFEYLESIDRRYIYLVLAVVVVAPWFFNIKLPLKYISPEAKSLFDTIQNLPEGSVIILSIDYDPSTAPELQPMAIAILRHAFQHHIKVLITCQGILGLGQARLVLDRVVPEFPVRRGEDYVFLGYKPMFEIGILQMGTSFQKAWPMDQDGVRFENLPLMRRIRNFEDIGLAISLSGTSVGVFWIQYGHEYYGLKVALGVTAVMASENYPYLQSGQIVGMLSGLKGAAEYETLIHKPDFANRGMVVQSYVHLLILAFVFLGNLGYFLSRKKEDR